MYAPFDNHSPLSQGDIINNVVLSYLPEISNPAFVLNEEFVERDLAQPLDEGMTVLVQAHKSPVLIVEPSCSIDNGDFISVARILPFTDQTYEGIPVTRPHKKAKHIRMNYQRVGVQPSLYYLQECPDRNFPKSVASFLELHTIRQSRPNLEYLTAKLVLRLADEAIGDLQYRIGFFFGRYAFKTDNYMLTQTERDAELAQAAGHALPAPTNN
jgi:hypothetical protein